MATCPTCRKSYGDGVSVCPDDGQSLLPDEAFAQADEDLAPGTVVGEYRVNKKIGAGTYAASTPPSIRSSARRPPSRC